MSNSQRKDIGYDECALRGICSISPALSSMQAVIFVYIQGLAFYLNELDKLGVSNEKVKQDFLEVFSGLISNVEYSQENLNNVISVLYADIIKAKEVYRELCAKNNVAPNYRKTVIKISDKFNITEAIKQGQKYFTKKESQLDPVVKKKLDILLIVLKSICMYMVELQDLAVNVDVYYKALINALGAVDVENIKERKIEKLIDEYVMIDNELLEKVYESRKAQYGDFISTEVSLSPKIGKAILVAGNNLKELELILQATQDKGIDVYTHGQMIVAHSYSKFKEYPHLVGHFGKGIEHGVIDFSEFPGAIFLTRLSLYRVERLYRSRIFTSDKIAPMGVFVIKENDFTPLIKSALSAEGFVEPSPKKHIHVGFVEDELNQKLKEISDKIKTNEIKHIFTIGVSNRTHEQKEYFEKFLELLKDDCFVFSFSYTNDSDKVMVLSIDYGFPIVYRALKTFARVKPMTELKPTCFYTRCEPHTVPNLFYMKAIGIDNIYFGSCASSMINPALIDIAVEMLDIHKYTTPAEDLKKMLEG